LYSHRYLLQQTYLNFLIELWPVIFPTNQQTILSTSGPTAGVTGKRGIWREKARDRIRHLGLNPESVGERPHLSGARGVGLLLLQNILIMERHDLRWQ
jgi:hypothetical protein